MESHLKLQNPENIITFIQHEHPLQLVDLQPCYPDYTEYSDDEEEDKVIKWDFNSPCDWCGKDINVYHRYYYKCTDSCDYVLHISCAQGLPHALPTTLIVNSHSPTHKLTLSQRDNERRYCDVCGAYIYDEWCYDCSICSRFRVPYWRSIHVKCAMIGRENHIICHPSHSHPISCHIIYHPSHIHPLQSVTSKPILCECVACGKKHEGIFYHCTTCFDYTIHTDCAFLPRTLQNQHTHPLIISYSTQYMDRSIREYGFPCRICRAPFGLKYLWIYKCESCRYFVHLDCATTSRSAGIGENIKNYKDADHPNLLNLPFPDHTYSILQHWVSKELGSTTAETSEWNLQHIGHEHVLSLVGTQSNDSKGECSSSVSSISCHNPMKSIELLCNGCVRPIMDVPFYKCSSENQRCDFVLHEWCTRLPAELPNHPGHAHTLKFLPKVSRNMFGIFWCKICKLRCNGFAYGCTECEYYIDVNCGFIPEEITHEAHPDHILSRCDRRSMRKPCVADGIPHWESEISFSCRSCDFYIHSDCALFLPDIINHKLDKHPMKLTYGPVENHKSEYFCEVCEEELDPTKWFYHCDVCAYSLHTRCAPVILNFQAAFDNYRSLYQFLNIKFGGIYNIKGHEHSVSLAVGSDADGKCPICHRDVTKQIIIKCQNCKLAMHYKRCLRRLM